MPYLTGGFPTPAVSLEALRRVALVWGTYFLLRAGVRLLAFATLSTDAYVLVVALSDVPFLIALLGWSVWFTTRAVRRDPAFAVPLEAA